MIYKWLSISITVLTRGKKFHYMRIILFLFLIYDKYKYDLKISIIITEKKNYKIVVATNPL